MQFSPYQNHQLSLEMSSDLSANISIILKPIITLVFLMNIFEYIFLSI